MMHNLPWQVKRRVVVQVVQVVSGPPNFEIRIIQQYFWLPRHIFHLEQLKSDMFWFARKNSMNTSFDEMD